LERIIRRTKRIKNREQSGKANQVKETDQEEVKKQSTKKIECFICGEDHYANSCPHCKNIMGKPQTKVREEQEGFASAVWEANAYHTMRTYQVNAVGFKGFSPMEVLLDIQAGISIMRPELVRAIWPVEEVLWVNGVGGVQLELHRAGYLDDFFEVYVSKETRVSILSFSEVEEVYPITYIPFEGFMVHMQDRDVMFN